VPKPALNVVVFCATAVLPVLSYSHDMRISLASFLDQLVWGGRQMRRRNDPLTHRRTARKGRLVFAVAGAVGLAGMATLFFPSTAPGALGAYPSCGKIAFSRNGSGTNRAVFLSNADGTNQIKITNSALVDTFDDWSPDGTRFVFTRSTDFAGIGDIWVANSDGTNPLNVTNNPANDEQPVWSPDGTRIAFTSNRSGVYAIWIINSDGTNPTRLTNSTANEDIPVWSPDGTRIAYRRATGRNINIWVVNIDGTNPIDVSNSPLANDSIQRWSPDGSRIAFSRRVPGDLFSEELWVNNSDGTNPTKITNTAAVSESGPSWSPEGTRIAYTRRPIAGLFFDDVWVSNSDGTNPTNLTNTPTQMENYAQWSPDGSRIAFTSDRVTNSLARGDYNIWVSNSDGTNPVNISNNPAHEFGQKWGPCSPSSTTMPSTTTTTTTTASSTTTSTTTLSTTALSVASSTIAPTSSNAATPAPTTTSTKPSVLVFPSIPPVTSTTQPATTTTVPATAPPTAQLPVPVPVPVVLNVKPTAIPVGAKLSLTGSGLQPGSEAAFEIHSTVLPLGKTNVTADGTFTYEIVLPAGVDPGNHEVIVNGTDQQGRATTKTFAVSVLGPTPTALSAPPAPAVAVNDQVAYTGSNTAPLTAAAALALLLGSVIWLRTRRE
jgi:Tol biopolymer transport system component